MSRTVERNCMRIYGCDFSAAYFLNGGAPLRATGSPASAYDKQKASAAARGIEWALTFPEWMRIWVSSGHLEKRGKGAGCYCMARNGDAGPYAAWNVSIQPVEVNSRDALAKARPNINASANGKFRRGTGRGWTFVAKGTKRPYQVCIGSTYVGSFATQREAEAAYAAAI